MSTVATKPEASKAAETEIKIKQEVVNLAELIKHDAKVDTETGIVTVTPDAYARLLPEGITIDIVKQLADHNANIAAATALAAGHIAIPAMKKHKDLNKVTLELPVTGKDFFAATFDRSRQVPDRSPESNGGVKTKFGSVSVDFVMYGTGSRGELVKVKKTLAAEALAAFGS